ncbi:MAG: Holliday junction resolvase RuvX [Candidatus Saccharibacteria bacterium]|nr:Holliday junction resolvase RuvX [Candidatus Saccharibacteria bacterium]
MRILALDVGTKRIGVAYADTAVRIAIPRGMVPVDGNELAEIAKKYRLEKADCIVSGRPRNNSGEETRQTEMVHNFIISLKDYFVKHEQKEPKVFFQDESYTSITAEELLKPTRADRKSGKVDEEAAAVILQDFLERPDLMQIEQEIKNV